MAKTFSEMYPEVAKGIEETEKQQENNVAAELLKSLTDTKTKDSRLTLRINTNSYQQLKRIAAKKGLNVCAIITVLINNYLSENQNLLD